MLVCLPMLLVCWHEEDLKAVSNVFESLACASYTCAGLLVQSRVDRLLAVDINAQQFVALTAQHVGDVLIRLCLYALLSCCVGRG